MNKEELIKHFKEWRDNDESKKIVAAFLVLPKEDVDNEILMWLAQAYIDTEEYKRAISVLEGLHESMDSDYKWHFMMGVALLRACGDEEFDDSDELKTDVLERAKVCFARGMNMNPPDNVLDRADGFVSEIEMLLSEINGEEEDDFNEDVECYEEDEYNAIEEHIKEYFGDFPTIFHETNSQDFICDIACIPPSPERNYYTLITIGMGAHIMNIPDTLEVEEFGRAELLICLPPDWKLGENSAEWFWPISLLKSLARLPSNHDSWLGWGHSVDNRETFSPNADFSAALLLYPEDVPTDALACALPNGDKVNFFEIVPLYYDEMIYKVSHGAKALLERMNSFGHIVDINRKCVCEDNESESSQIVDDVQRHSRKITEKMLPLDAINGCNHIAIFLRWCIERDCIAPRFYEFFPETVAGVKDGSNTDLREFIIESLKGRIKPFLLSYTAACFADCYYNWSKNDPKHFYPRDVDDYAEHYFGTEKYNCEEFQDEAYLFVPFDEEYYRGMSKYIDRAFEDFYPAFAEHNHCSDLEIISEAETILKIKLDLPNRGEFAKDFRNIEYLSKTEGFSAAPLILYKGSAQIDSNMVYDAFMGACDPMLPTIVAAKFPAVSPTEWAGAHFSKEKPAVVSKDERIKELCVRHKNELGAVPAIFAFNDQCATLLLPLENGDFLAYYKSL